MLAMIFGSFVLSGVGCMQGSYVFKDNEWGIVGVKSQADREVALDMIRKHVGSDYEIKEEYDPRQPPGFQPQAGIQPNTAPPKDGLGWYIKYAKKTPTGQAQANSGTPSNPITVAPQRGGIPGLPAPDMSGIQQTSYRQNPPVANGAIQQPNYPGAPIAATGMQQNQGLPANGRMPAQGTFTQGPTTSGMPGQPIGQPQPGFSPYGN